MSDNADIAVAGAPPVIGPQVPSSVAGPNFATANNMQRARQRSDLEPRGSPAELGLQANGNEDSIHDTELATDFGYPAAQSARTLGGTDVEWSRDQYFLSHLHLPPMLCASDAALTAGPAKMVDLPDTFAPRGDRDSTIADFVHEDCANYGPTKIAIASTVVRLINGANINNDAPAGSSLATGSGFGPSLQGGGIDARGQLMAGLSVVTNLPVHVVGNFNSSSWSRDPDSVRPTPSTPNPAKPWVPTMVAGDVLYAISNGWDDRQARWDIPPGHVGNWVCGTGFAVACSAGGATKARPTFHTSWNMAVLFGWPRSANGKRNAMQHLLRPVEGWSGNTTQHTGALFAAFNPVTQPYTFVHNDDWGASVTGDNGDARRNYSNTIREGPGSRDFEFDRHLDVITNQPPGAPEFNVSAVKRWVR